MIKKNYFGFCNSLFLQELKRASRKILCIILNLMVIH